MISQIKSLALPPDARIDQAPRYADFLEAHPDGVPDKQAQAECDLLSVTKLRSVMRKEWGYDIRKKRSSEVCQGGTRQRHCWFFYLVSRPSKQQQDLFDTQ
jgi:hypothetical protein